MGRRADHCAYSLLSAGATNAVPRAQERGDGAGVGLHTLLHLCHLRPRAQAGMFPLSSHHAVSYQPLSETVYPHSSEAYKQHCCACLPDQTLSRQTEQGPIWVSLIQCGEGALMMLLVMEPWAGEIQAQPGEQDFSWGRGSVRGGGSPPSPCRPTFSLPLPPPNPALHLLLAGRRSWDAANAGAHLAFYSFLSSQFKNNPGKYFSAGARCRSHSHLPPLPKL